MGHIELTLPDSLLRKAQAFEPEAQDALQSICDKCGIDAECSAIMRKDLAAFLKGQRSEDKADIDKITDLLKNAEIVYTIQNSGKYYIIELMRHYCDLAMKWEAFGVMFPMDTGDGRMFYRDFCAIAIVYLDATSAELKAIGTQGIEFERTGLQGTAYGTDADGNEFEHAVMLGARSQEAYLKAAISQAKEWRKLIAAGTPDAELQNTANYVTIARSIADVFTQAPTMIPKGAQREQSFVKAIADYNNAGGNMPVSDNYVTETFLGLAMFLRQSDLKPTRETATHKEYDTTLGELYRIAFHTTDAPDTATLNGFISSLRFWSQWRPVINGYVTLKYKSKIVQKPHRVDIRPIDFPVLPAPTKKDGKFERASMRTEITMRVDNMLLYGIQGHAFEVEDAAGKSRYGIGKDSAYILPADVMKGTHNTAEWSRFALNLKRAEHMAEDDLLERVFDYTNRKKQIQDDGNLKEEDKARRIDSIRKNKPRDKKQLASYFQKAQDLGLIEKYSNRTMKKGGKEWKWKPAKGAEVEEAQAENTLN